MKSTSYGLCYGYSAETQARAKVRLETEAEEVTKDKNAENEKQIQDKLSVPH